MPSLVTSVIVKFLSVATGAILSEAHTIKVSSFSATLIVTGRDTVTAEHNYKIE